MHLSELQRKLLAAARANPPAEGVPDAFEKRMLALLESPPALDYQELWARGLWRAAAACLMLMLLLSAWTLLTPLTAPSKDLSQDFETTMLAAVDQDSD
jgi:hypothetical protein